MNLCLTGKFTTTLMRIMKKRNVLFSIFVLGLLVFSASFFSQEYLSANSQSRNLIFLDWEDLRNFLKQTRLKIGIETRIVKMVISDDYKQRRQLVNSACDRNMKTNLKLIEANSLKGDKEWNIYYDYEDNLMVCTIDKVGSTNWYLDFLRLGVLRYPDKIFWENTTRDELRDYHYGIQRGEFKTLQEASENFLTAVFVRHPFQRLVSGYYDKIARPCPRFFPSIRKMILAKYRKNRNNNETNMDDLAITLNETETEFPSPYEFTQYIIDEMPNMGNIRNVNRHFAAQYTQCPFCSIHFDVIGKVETMSRDREKVIRGVRLERVINPSVIANGGNYDDERAKIFFSQLPKSFIQELYEFYKLDFEMFGYDHPTNFFQMGYDDEQFSNVSKQAIQSVGTFDVKSSEENKMEDKKSDIIPSSMDFKNTSLTKEVQISVSKDELKIEINGSSKAELDVHQDVQVVSNPSIRTGFQSQENFTDTTKKLTQIKDEDPERNPEDADHKSNETNLSEGGKENYNVANSPTDKESGKTTLNENLIENHDLDNNVHVDSNSSNYHFEDVVKSADELEKSPIPDPKNVLLYNSTDKGAGHLELNFSDESPNQVTDSTQSAKSGERNREEPSPSSKIQGIPNFETSSPEEENLKVDKNFVLFGDPISNAGTNNPHQKIYQNQDPASQGQVQNSAQVEKA